ncbi:MAG: cellulase family glycosylhydrolase, partial [Oscillospiraceae bacterium]|nr:cellulase family glycosylhydrolase [Oscillospiraceae bacterium]
QPEFWESHFADLHAIGVNAVRIWVNCDSMVSIKLKPSGQVREVVEKHWTDVDKLFEIAEKNQIYLMPTLLSFDHCKNGQYVDRWRAVITDDTAMQSYIDSYVKPFAERYGSNPYLLGIDLMNEPDWVIENAECGRLPKENLSKFFAKCTAAIHETNPDALVTVGMGMVKYNSDNPKYMGNVVSDEVMKSYAGDNACLDFYSVHYYNWMKSHMGCPFDMSPTDFGLDGTKPSFLGEFSPGPDQTYEYAYENTLANGWNGAMLWCSNNGAEHADSWDKFEVATKKVESLYPDKVYPLGKN